MNDRLITVTYSVRDELVADTIKLSLRAVGEAKKYEEAAAKAEKLAGDAVSGLKELGLDPRSSGINVCAIRADKKVSGYRAVRSYSVEFAVSDNMLGAALDALSACECEFAVAFALKDGSHRDRLLTEAVKGARSRAEVIAAADGVRLGALAKAEHMSSDVARPAMMFARSAMNSADAEPERIAVEQSVTCAWHIE